MEIESHASSSPEAIRECAFQRHSIEEKCEYYLRCCAWRRRPLRRPTARLRKSAAARRMSQSWQSKSKNRRRWTSPAAALSRRQRPLHRQRRRPRRRQQLQIRRRRQTRLRRRPMRRRRVRRKRRSPPRTMTQQTKSQRWWRNCSRKWRRRKRRSHRKNLWQRQRFGNPVHATTRYWEV